VISSRGAVVAALVLAAALSLAIAHGPLGDLCERFVGILQNAMNARATAAPLSGPRLYAFAFGGGVVASLSPCILGMLPVNLSYIGAQRLSSRFAAVRVATLFVLGVVVVTVAVGLVSSLFFALFVSFRGEVNIAVGVLTVVMAAWMAGFIRLPVPAVVRAVPRGAGAFAVGIVFALAASPCASPVLVTVLGAAAGGGAVVSMTAMAVYAIGYTLLLWLASVFAGVTAASRTFLAHGDVITRVSAVFLLLVGVGSIVYGVRQLG
jgi:cytochrome c-type biogenesis protein